MSANIPDGNDVVPSTVRAANFIFFGLLISLLIYLFDSSMRPPSSATTESPQITRLTHANATRPMQVQFAESAPYVIEMPKTISLMYADAAMPKSLQAEVSNPSVQEKVPTSGPEILTPRMRVALDHVSRRYRISSEALVHIFQTVQFSGRECSLDPLLIVAVIGIESGFNPLAESTMGALGLMQIMPRMHLDKLPPGSGMFLFLDPVTNVRIGSLILEESIRRQGGLIAGLQQYGGAVNDEGQLYSKKVLAEKERLEQAVR